MEHQTHERWQTGDKIAEEKAKESERDATDTR